MTATDPRELLRTERRIAIAALSTVDAARWRLPEYEPVQFHRELGALCDRVADSSFARSSLQVMVGAPPRHGKTELIGLAMVTRAMILAWRERRKFLVLYVTATDDLAREIGLQLQGVAERLYAETGDIYFKPGGSWAAERWKTEGGFGVRTIGRKGATGGVGCHLLILDDLIGHNSVYRSPTERANIRRAVGEDFRSRLMEGGATIHMETRRGTEDTTAWLMEEEREEWEHHVWTCHDPHGLHYTVDGVEIVERDTSEEYLWSRQMNAERRKKQKLTDTKPLWLSLYQQRPIPEGGTRLALELLQHTYPETPAAARARADRVVIGVDLAATGKTTSDHCAFVVMAYRGPFRDVLEVVRRQVGFTSQVAIIQELSTKWKPNDIVVELAAGGHQLVDSLQKSVPRLYGRAPVGDKVMRLEVHEGTFEAGQVRTPRDSDANPWVFQWREELAAFTGTPGETDDQVDATVWALVPGEGPARVETDDLAKALRMLG